jgi:hypothetical protein
VGYQCTQKYFSYDFQDSLSYRKDNFYYAKCVRRIAIINPPEPRKQEENIN